MLAHSGAGALLFAAEFADPLDRLRADRSLPAVSHFIAVAEAAVAAVVLEPGATLSADDVIEHVRSRLAAYKRPRHVCFVPRLPRTAASQQVHKTLLREIVLAELAAHAADAP